MKMIRQSSALSLVTLLLLAAGQFACDREGKISERETAAQDARIGRIEANVVEPTTMVGAVPATLEERMRFFNIPGVAIAVIENYEVSWAKGYGEAAPGRAMTADTLVQAGGLSRAATAVGALQLAEAGKLSLDEPIQNALVSWKLPTHDLAKQSVLSMRRLLSYSAGISIPVFPGYALGKVVPTLKQVELGEPPALTGPIEVVIAPETVVAVSAGGYVVAQQAMMDRSGTSFEAWMQEQVLDPFGMSQTTFEQPLSEDRRSQAAVGHYVDRSPVEGGFRVYPELAADGMWTTANDLARFGAGLQRAIRGEQGGALKPSWAKSLATDQMGGQGLGFVLATLGNATYLQRSGANTGFYARLLLHRDNGYGLAFVANSASANQLAEEMVTTVAREYGWEGIAQGEVEWSKLEPQRLAAFAGRYHLGGDRILSLTVEGDHLVASETTRQFTDLVYPQGDDILFRKRFNTPLTFEFGEDGRAVSYSLKGPKNSVIVRPRIPDGAIQPAELLLDGKTEAALAAYRQAGLTSPQRLNTFGYQLLARRRLEEGLALFELNTELFPTSPNVWDSLGDGLIEVGQTAEAAKAYRRALSLVEGSTLTESERKFLADHSQRQLAWLEASE